MIFSRYTILITIFLFVQTLSFANHTRLSRADYITRYRHIAIDHQQRYGIPASITMAQGILESDSGNSTLSRGSNNHFGIKCKSYWKGRTYYYTDDAPDECFRAYDTVEESYEDHAVFLESSPRYDPLFMLKPTDYKGWAHGLKSAGYATAPDYAEKLIKLIEDNKLHELDKMAAGNAPSPIPHQTPTKVIDPNNNIVGRDSHHGYTLQKHNGAYYITLRKGDTLKSIARDFNISKSRLRKLNKLERKVEPQAGDKIYIE
ncbi:MAG: glucosaminidase domain-containing protein [Rikenellaceae bacterium]